MSEVESVHAPKYSLWLGARLGVLLYFGGMYYTDPNTGNEERVSSFVTNGIAPEVDLGARISRRYIPYLALELGFVGPGSRFPSAGRGRLPGPRTFVGSRLPLPRQAYPASVSFASDLSLGFRKFQVDSGGSTWTGSAFEFLRLGLGADIRFTDYFTISPMITLSGGSVSEGHQRLGQEFAPNQPDAATMSTGPRPATWGSNNIPGWAADRLRRHRHRLRRAFDLLSSHE